MADNENTNEDLAAQVASLREEITSLREQLSGDAPPEQLTSTEGMTPEQIVKATNEGRLDDYLRSPR